jgi:hypothetical protein
VDARCVVVRRPVSSGGTGRPKQFVSMRRRRRVLDGVLELAYETLDVDAADLEQAPIVPPAPSRELTQVEGVGVAVYQW